VAYSGVTRAQAGTLEAVAESARDGSLVCIVQVRVALVASGPVRARALRRMSGRGVFWARSRPMG
jgi:hypothetical protein